jgi:uncharacterized membrane protein YukC
MNKAKKIFRSQYLGIGMIAASVPALVMSQNYLSKALPHEESFTNKYESLAQADKIQRYNDSLDRYSCAIAIGIISLGALQFNYSRYKKRPLQQ